MAKSYIEKMREFRGVSKSRRRAANALVEALDNPRPRSRSPRRPAQRVSTKAAAIKSRSSSRRRGVKLAGRNSNPGFTKESGNMPRRDSKGRYMKKKRAARRSAREIVKENPRRRRRRSARATENPRRRRRRARATYENPRPRRARRRRSYRARQTVVYENPRRPRRVYRRRRTGGRENLVVYEVPTAGGAQANPRRRRRRTARANPVRRRRRTRPVVHAYGKGSRRRQMTVVIKTSPPPKHKRRSTRRRRSMPLLPPHVSENFVGGNFLENPMSGGELALGFVAGGVAYALTDLLDRVIATRLKPGDKGYLPPDQAILAPPGLMRIGVGAAITAAPFIASGFIRQPMARAVLQGMGLGAGMRLVGQLVRTYVFAKALKDSDFGKKNYSAEIAAAQSAEAVSKQTTGNAGVMGWPGFRALAGSQPYGIARGQVGQGECGDCAPKCGTQSTDNNVEKLLTNLQPPVTPATERSTVDMALRAALDEACHGVSGAPAPAPRRAGPVFLGAAMFPDD